MTKRDFFILIIKLFGLYSIVQAVFSVLPSTLIYLSSWSVENVLTIIVIVTLTVGLFWLLIYQAGWLVDVLKLEKSLSEDRIALGDLKADTIIKIGTFVLGGLMFIDSIPGLLSNLYWATRSEASGNEYPHPTTYDLTMSIIGFIAGYILFTNYDWVAKWWRRKEGTPGNDRGVTSTSR